MVRMVIAGLVLVALVAACGGGDRDLAFSLTPSPTVAPAVVVSEDEGFVTYRDDEGFITIMLPERWEVLQDLQAFNPEGSQISYVLFAGVRQNPPFISPLLNVLTQPLSSQPESIEGLLEAHLEDLRTTFDTLEVLWQEATEVSGRPAMLVEYRGGLGRQTVQAMAMVVWDGDVRWVGTCGGSFGGESTDRAECEGVLRSIRIVE
ncbi:MAG: hypothetical protein O2854_07240 [Chloroflexi bacterium]|nr:hypothetical protein [Chloroflexota bacterium]